MIFRGCERLNTPDPTDTLQPCVSTFLPLNPQRNTSLKKLVCNTSRIIKEDVLAAYAFIVS